jgi:hypothetical protein
VNESGASGLTPFFTESPSILKIPAPLLFYFMGEMEIQQH